MTSIISSDKGLNIVQPDGKCITKDGTTTITSQSDCEGTWNQCGGSNDNLGMATAGGIIFHIGSHSEKLGTLGLKVSALEKKEEYTISVSPDYLIQL